MNHLQMLLASTSRVFPDWHNQVMEDLVLIWLDLCCLEILFVSAQDLEFLEGSDLFQHGCPLSEKAL